MKNKIVIGFIVLIIVLFVFIYQKNSYEEITNFEECVEAGNPVMESYPRQCRDGDKTFIEILNNRNYCEPRQREVGDCIALYEPVCGYPENKEYSNSCFACMDEKVEYYLEGECSECEQDSDCVVFGEDGDCNCGCYNKDMIPTSSGGDCFCAAPTSCECVEGKCEGVLG